MSIVHILLVEDNPDHAELTRLALAREYENAELHAVLDGESALDYLAGREPYDDRSEYPLPHLIILDLGLPRVSGLEVLKWIGAKLARLDIPVIVLSSSIDPESKQRAFALGVRGYVEKTPDFTDIVSPIRELIEQRAQTGDRRSGAPTRRSGVVDRRPDPGAD